MTKVKIYGDPRATHATVVPDRRALYVKISLSRTTPFDGDALQERVMDALDEVTKDFPAALCTSATWHPL